MEFLSYIAFHKAQHYIYLYKREVALESVDDCHARLRRLHEYNFILTLYEKLYPEMQRQVDEEFNENLMQHGYTI